ncbi:BatA domain-containing protein [candidate division WOR-3 bacterium]|nr:BatA domain-containing protein [candidate division WOR-3 bacterium]
MSFLSPLFLFGLFSLPIPFLIHLWHRHRLKQIWFPSISLLKSAEQGQRALRKLKDIILLVLRTLALLFLVLGFANPSIFRKQRIAILDDSWDMNTLSGSHTLFEKGIKTASKLKNTKILLASGKPYPSECKYQKFSLPTEDFCDYIITKTGKLPDTLIGKAKLIELTGDEDNFSMDSLAFKSSFLVFVTNHTPQERKKLITLFTIHNSQPTTYNSQLLIPPHSTSTAIFPMFSEACAGSVKIEEQDALSLDNTRYFVHSPPPKLKVLLVGNSNDAFFLKNALSPPEGGSKIQAKISSTLVNPFLYDMIVFVGSPPHSYKKTLSLPTHAQKVSGFLTLDNILESHPIFSGFDLIPELKQIKFTQREFIKPLRDEPQGKIIARFSDGSPAIIEPEPQTLVFSFPLSREAGEFVLTSLFVPLMHRIAYYLAGKPVEQHNFIVGEPVRFKVSEFKSYKCVGPLKIALLTPETESDGIYIHFTPEVPGIYEISGGTKFAVNLSNSLIYPSLDLEHQRERVSIKKWFFIFALLLLIAELIIRRI